MADIQWDSVYKQNKDVVAREIENEYILVPVTAGIGDLDEEIYALNETGRLIWDKIDGIKDINAVKAELLSEFKVQEQGLARDINGFVQELEKRNILIKVS